MLRKITAHILLIGLLVLEIDRTPAFALHPEMAGTGDIPIQHLAPTTQTWHVATTGSDVTGDGSETAPFATIQHGIDAAISGDTVLVQPGIYRENINFNGKNITVGSLFIATDDKDYILQTIIDGNHSSHVVTFANGESAAAKLSGFTITNGYAHGTPWPGSSGGGILCLNSNPTLARLKVVANEATEEGGGLYLAYCSATIQTVSIVNNRASGGGGIRFSYGEPTLESVVVAGNSADMSGGGMFFYHANATVKNALVVDNIAFDQLIGDGGGGLMFDGCNPTFINVTVAGNWTAGHGGGLHVSFSSNPTLVNSIVWGNAPEQIYFDTDWPGEAITIDYSDVQGGAAGIVTNGHGPVYWGDGNMDAAPRFMNAGLGNYRLADDSPAINAGTMIGAPLTDIEGTPRPSPLGSKPDLGAYENSSGTDTLVWRIYLPILYSSPPEPPLSVTPGIMLQTPRALHTATRLLNGKILIVGGTQASDAHLSSVELFDPIAGTSSPVASLHTPRHGHTATLLPDGRVLVVGGYTLPQQWLADAEVYDPVADTWTVVSPHHSHGVQHTATVMDDGRVLVVGGCIGSGVCTDRVEIFNPPTNTWTDATPLTSDRASQTAHLLLDGRVLIAGGWGASNIPIGGDALYTIRRRTPGLPPGRWLRRDFKHSRFGWQMDVCWSRAALRKATSGHSKYRPAPRFMILCRIHGQPHPIFHRLVTCTH